MEPASETMPGAGVGKMVPAKGRGSEIVSAIGSQRVVVHSSVVVHNYIAAVPR